MTEVAIGRDIALDWDTLVTPGFPAPHQRLGSGHETADVVADIVDTYLWQERRRPHRALSGSGQSGGALWLSARVVKL